MVNECTTLNTEIMNCGKTSHFGTICAVVILSIVVSLLLLLGKNENTLCEPQLGQVVFSMDDKQGMQGFDSVLIAAKQAPFPLAAGHQDHQDVASQMITQNEK